MNAEKPTSIDQVNMHRIAFNIPQYNSNELSVYNINWDSWCTLGSNLVCSVIVEIQWRLPVRAIVSCRTRCCSFFDRLCSPVCYIYVISVPLLPRTHAVELLQYFHMAGRWIRTWQDTLLVSVLVSRTCRHSVEHSHCWRVFGRTSLCVTFW